MFDFLLDVFMDQLKTFLSGVCVGVCLVLLVVVVVWFWSATKVPVPSQDLSDEEYRAIFRRQLLQGEGVKEA